MVDPRQLFRLIPEVNPCDDKHTGEDQILLVTMGGYADAGATQELISSQLSQRLTSHDIGTFDTDQLYDYAGRRPRIVFDHDHFTDYQAPQIVLRHVTDEAGKNFYWLTGPEPSFQWEKMIGAVSQIIDDCSIRRVVILQSISSPTPHTRPICISGFASDPQLLEDLPGLPGTFQISSGFDSLLTLRLGEQGKEVVGLVAHVPHYLADSRYPEAAIALLNRARSISGLCLPSDGELAEAAQSVRQAIDQQVLHSPEIQQMISKLEDQYQAYMHRPELTSQISVLSADEIGAEVEQFLKDLDDENPDRPAD